MIRDLNERAQYIDLKQKQLVAQINKIRSNAKTGTGSTSISLGEPGKKKEIYAGKLEQFTRDGYSQETTEKKGKKKQEQKPKEKPKS